MSVRIELYTKPGEGASVAVASQIRSLITELRIDAGLHLITDEALLTSNGIEKTPAVFVDGMMISNGWAPSRMEIRRALEKRIEALTPKTGENT